MNFVVFVCCDFAVGLDVVIGWGGSSKSCQIPLHVAWTCSKSGLVAFRLTLSRFN